MESKQVVKAMIGLDDLNRVDDITRALNNKFKFLKTLNAMIILKNIILHLYILNSLKHNLCK